MFPDNGESSGSLEAVVTREQLKRERLRLTRVESKRTQTAQCAVEVELEWMGGERVVGRAEGQTSTAGDLRCAAEAAIDAIERFSAGVLELELLGVKALRAFDANIVIV